MLEIKEGKSKFYIGEDENAPLAEIIYTSSDDGKITIEHTIVSDELQGQGIAKKLLTRAVEYARENNKKIIPMCSYVKDQFERNEYEYEDIWYR